MIYGEIPRRQACHNQSLWINLPLDTSCQYKKRILSPTQFFAVKMHDNSEWQTFRHFTWRKNAWDVLGGAVKWLAAAAGLWRPHSDQIMIPQQHSLGTVQHNKHKFHICASCSKQKGKRLQSNCFSRVNPIRGPQMLHFFFPACKRGPKGEGGFTQNVNYFPSDFI